MGAQLSKTRAKINRKCGLITLPSEILLEIASYFPELSTAEILDDLHALPTDSRQRFAALRSLSQTCKDLRAVVLPLAWERLEACTADAFTEKPAKQQVGSTLKRKCKGLLQSSHLIPYVRIVTISLTKYRVATVLPIFVKCLQALTNLHTIQIVYADPRIETLINNAFEGRIFPTVRTLILPYVAHGILRRCPNVEDLTCNDHDGSGSKICDSLVAAKLTKLKTLRRVVANELMVERMADIAPNIELIRFFSSELENPGLQSFLNFNNLDTFEIQFYDYSDMSTARREQDLEKQKASVVRIAQDVLKASKSTRKKTIKLLYTQLVMIEVHPKFEFYNYVLRVFKEETILL